MWLPGNSRINEQRGKKTIEEPNCTKGAVTGGNNYTARYAGRGFRRRCITFLFSTRLSTSESSPNLLYLKRDCATLLRALDRSLDNLDSESSLLGRDDQPRPVPRVNCLARMVISGLAIEGGSSRKTKTYLRNVLEPGLVVAREGGNAVPKNACQCLR